jgi:Mrp family chromosome partitioning ATPase
LDPVDEQRIEVGRYVEALRRGWPLVLLLLVSATAAAIVASLLTPESYRATARIVIDDPIVPVDDSAIDRRLATVRQLLTTRRVLDEAADAVGGGVTAAELSGQVASSIDPEASIINVVATARDPGLAAQIANAVANAFIVEQTNAERERLARARVALLEELDRVTGEAEGQAIRDRLSSLALAEASVGTELAVAEPAEPPAAPFSPRPLRNAVLAFFAALFLAVLVVVAREQLRPRLSGPRELSRLTNLPILTGIPLISGMRGQRSVVRGMEREGYQTLQTLVTFQLPATKTRSLLITGAVHEEGKTRAAIGLARALVRSGHKALLVSADVRWPTLHREFGLAVQPGLTDVLSAPGGTVKSNLERLRMTLSRQRTDAEQGLLEVIPSGVPQGEPAQLFNGPALKAFFAAAGEAGFEYVILDGPPIIGLADSQILAQRVDAVLVVSRIDRLDVDTAIDLRETFERLKIEPLGIVAVGVRATMSPYFLRPRATSVEA